MAATFNEKEKTVTTELTVSKTDWSERRTFDVTFDMKNVPLTIIYLYAAREMARLEQVKLRELGERKCAELPKKLTIDCMTLMPTATETKKREMTEIEIYRNNKDFVLFVSETFGSTRLPEKTWRVAITMYKNLKTKEQKEEETIKIRHNNDRSNMEQAITDKTKSKAKAN